MSALCSILFFGGWLPPFEFLNFIPGPFWIALKTWTVGVMFVVIRCVLPRFRYDQLMILGWTVFVPGTIAYTLFIMCYYKILFGSVFIY